MIKDYLEEYKREVKAQYEKEKNGSHSSLLIHPSRAKLRKLCLQIFKSNTNSDDLKSFAFFFGFEFNPENTNKLKDNTDKFRPIETFFKGETDLSDIEAVNLAAILVNFKYRPYVRYSKIDLDKDLNNEETETEKPDSGQEPPTKPTEPTNLPVRENLILAYIKKHKLSTAAISLIVIISGVTTFKNLTKENECMEWKNNQYEEVNCDEISKMSQGIMSQSAINPKEDYLLNHFKKIEPCDTTTYFRNGKACIWYWKTPDDKLDCFTAPGFHPVNGKNLRPITQHMIDKYVLSK